MMIELRRGQSRQQQAITVLLLILGVTSNSDGLKCYSCNGANCDAPGNSQTKDCSANMDTCITSGTPGNMTRDCSYTTTADCIKREAGGDCYDPGIDSDMAILGSINKCIEDTKKEGETVNPLTNQGSTCMCSTDSCNAISTNVRPPPSKHNASEGHGDLQCYKCSGNMSSPCWKVDSSVTILDKCGGCEKTVTVLSQGEQRITRGCVPKAWTQCIVETAKGKNCFEDQSGDENSQKLAKEWGACVDVKGGFGHQHNKGRENVESTTTIKTRTYCGCETNLCNPAGHIFSTGPLIFSGFMLAKCFSSF